MCEYVYVCVDFSLCVFRGGDGGGRCRLLTECVCTCVLLLKEREID